MYKGALLGLMHKGERAAECAFCKGLIYSLGFIWQNAQFVLMHKLVTGVQRLLLSSNTQPVGFCVDKNRHFSLNKLHS